MKYENLNKQFIEGEWADGSENGQVDSFNSSVNDGPHTAFGVEKNSGTGRFGDDMIIEGVITVQWISVQAETSQHPF